MRLNYPIRKWTRFAKSFSSNKHPRVKYTYGFRCINFVVNIDDKFIFKFPLGGDGKKIAIRDLKKTKTDRASIMHGWNQNDLWDNFIINPKTFEVVAVIDWEEAGFNDFYDCFTHGTKNTNVKNALLREYLKLYMDR